MDCTRCRGMKTTTSGMTRRGTTGSFTSSGTRSRGTRKWTASSSGTRKSGMVWTPLVSHPWVARCSTLLSYPQPPLSYPRRISCTRGLLHRTKDGNLSTILFLWGRSILRLRIHFHRIWWRVSLLCLVSSLLALAVRNRLQELLRLPQRYHPFMRLRQLIVSLQQLPPHCSFHRHVHFRPLLQQSLAHHPLTSLLLRQQLLQLQPLIRRRHRLRPQLRPI